MDDKKIIFQKRHIFLFLIAIGVLLIFLILKLSSSKDNHQMRIELVNLLSFANFYNGKKVCTRGYYVRDSRLSIIKVRLDEVEYVRSAWVVSRVGDIIKTPQAGQTWIEAEICGIFESRRDGQFGDPAVWQHQITVDSYKLFQP